MRKPVNWIFKYYQQITDGSVIVGKWIRLLYENIVNGIEAKQYVFDQKKANSAIEWIESHCFHTIGFLAPGNLLLQDWQKALISCLFGILDPETGKRQFRELVFIVARKNGKSLLASAIAKYILYIEGGYGTRIFCTAPKLDQADIIYDNIWQMITLDPEWQAEEDQIRDSIKGHNKKAFDDSNHAKKRVKGISIEGTNSIVKKIAFSDRKSDGFDPSLVICHEIASWPGDKGLKQYEVWKSACGAREMGESPSIILSCSTAGYINEGIYDENIKRSTRFLLGESREKRILPVLYMIDDVEKWNDITELHKSNPNLGVSVSVDYLLDEIAVAEGSLSKRSEFIVKYANIKQNSSLAWLPASTVEAACGDALDLEDFRNTYCVGGIDLSQTRDLTAATAVIEKDGELFVFARFWRPAEKIEEAEQRDGVPYRLYIQRGLLFPSGDNFIDYNDCFNWFKELVERNQIYPLQVGYDRYSAQYLVNDMKQYGFHMDDVFQGDNLHGVIQETQGLLEDGKIHIGDNDLLKMHLLNSAVKMNVERGRGKLVKLTPQLHIDGTAALLDAMTVRQKWYSDIGEQLQNRGD